MIERGAAVAARVGDFEVSLAGGRGHDGEAGLGAELEHEFGAGGGRVQLQPLHRGLELRREDGVEEHDIPGQHVAEALQVFERDQAGVLEIVEPAGDRVVGLVTARYVFHRNSGWTASSARISGEQSARP